MSETVYKQTVAEKIRDLIKDQFGEAFREYRVGDPVEFSQSQLPAIIVTETNVRVVQDATGYDGLIHSLLIQVIYNKKEEIGRPVEGNTLDTIIDNYIYGRDPVDNMYADSSILGVLRTNLTLDNMTIQQEVNIRKGVVPRPAEQMTAEGHLEIEVHELQPVNNRV